MYLNNDLSNNVLHIPWKPSSILIKPCVIVCPSPYLGAVKVHYERKNLSPMESHSTPQDNFYQEITVFFRTNALVLINISTPPDASLSWWIFNKRPSWINASYRINAPPKQVQRKVIKELMNSRTKTRFELNIYHPIVMLYVVVVKLILRRENYYRVRVVVCHFLDRSNGRIFFTSTFLLSENKRLSRINAPPKVWKFSKRSGRLFGEIWYGH